MRVRNASKEEPKARPSVQRGKISLSFLTKKKKRYAVDLRREQVEFELKQRREEHPQTRGKTNKRRQETDRGVRVVE